MMKTMMLGLAIGAASILAAPAAAATFSPAATTVPFQGTLTIFGGAPPIITCNVTLNMTINAAGDTATITSGSAAPGNPPCSLLALNFTTPWGVAVTATTPGGVATNLDISGVRAISPVTTCGWDTLEVQWNDATDTVAIPWQQLTGSPNPCWIGGTLTANTNVTITDP